MSTLKEVRVPDLGNVTAAAIIEISIKPGDRVFVEDALITLESDKASMDIPAPFSGTVKEIRVKVGDKVSSGDLIALLETQSGASVDSSTTLVDASAAAKRSVAAVKAAAASSSSGASPSASTSPIPGAESPQISGAQHTQVLERSDYTEELEQGKDVHAGPGVRRLAREFGIHLEQVVGTGERGRITQEDLQRYVKARLQGHPQQGTWGGTDGLPAAPTVDFGTFGEIHTQPLPRIKKLTAKHVHRNWLLVPHVTQFNEADITELEAFRRAQAAFAEKHAVKLTLLAFTIKAVLATLREFPQFNASLSADGEELILKKYFHIGIAVDTSGGLVVPVIRDVDQKSLLELAKELAVVGQRARAQQLSSAELQGSSFTISSLGGIGGTYFTPIVNVPDVAILGVSKAQYKPHYQGNEFVPRLMLPLSLSYDHRVIDGAEGARFIVYLAACLSDIRRWLL